MKKVTVKTKKATVFIDENKYYVWGVFAAFLIFLIAFSTYKIEEDDVLWHLATGKFIVENKYVPDKDVFGFATQNTEWIPFEWGWDVISFSIHSIGGITALSIFRTIIFCLIFFLYFLLLKKFKVNTVVSIILFFLLLFGMVDRLSPRPHIFTYLFFVILLYLFLTFKYINREKYFKRLYFLPLIFLVWANLHLGVIAGGLLLFSLVISEILIYYYPSRFSSKEITPLSKDQLKKLVIISFVSAIVLLINPHGFNTYTYAYSHTKMKMLEMIAEWHSPFAGTPGTGLVTTLYKIFLFSGIIVLIYAYKKRDLTFGLVYLAFAIYSFRAIRFTVDYEIVIVFFIAVSADYFLKRSPSLTKLLNGNPSKTIAAVCLIFISYQTLTGNLYSYLKFNREIGTRISEKYTPIPLFNFMKQNNITGTPLNNFETGGYQLWNFPNQKIFIDSRNLSDEIFNEYMSMLYMKPGFEKKFEQYGIDYVIFFEPRFQNDPNILKKTVTDALFKSKNWKLVYWDDTSILFVKDIPKYADLISKYEYKILNLYTAVFQQKEFETNIKSNPELAKEELRKKLAAEPNGFFIAGMNQILTKVLKQNN